MYKSKCIKLNDMAEQSEREREQRKCDEKSWNHLLVYILLVAFKG